MCVMSKVKSLRHIRRKVQNLCNSVEQRKALELMAIVERKCPIGQQDGYDTVWWLTIKACRVRKHITSVSAIKQERSEGSTKAASMALTDFGDHLNAPGASFLALTSSSFPSLTDFSVSATSESLKWTDVEQNVVYQIVSIRIVNTQYGQSVILSLQKADGSSCSVWACGMLTKELLQNPMMMVSSQLFV